MQCGTSRHIRHLATRTDVRYHSQLRASPAPLSRAAFTFIPPSHSRRAAVSCCGTSQRQPLGGRDENSDLLKPNSTLSAPARDRPGSQGSTSGAPGKGDRVSSSSGTSSSGRGRGRPSRGSDGPGSSGRGRGGGNVSSSSGDSKGGRRGPAPESPPSSGSKRQRTNSTPGLSAGGDRRKGPNALAQSMARTQAIKEAKAAEDLLLVVQKHAADLGAVNISAAFTHAARLCRNGVPPQQQPAAVQQLLHHLHQLAEQQKQQCGARQLANIIWSCGRLQYPATIQLLLPELLQARKLQQADPQTVSNTLWAAAKVELQLEEGVVQQLMQRFMQVLPDTNAQGVSNTLWAAAKLELQLPEGVVQQLMQQFMQVLPDATAQAVSNTLWAAATLGVRLPEGVVQQLVRHFMQVLQQANAQSISNTVWAVSSLGQQVPAHQLQQLLTHLQAQLRDCRPQALANTLLACGRMQYAPLQLLSALEQQPVQLERVLAASVSQDLAEMAWACGQLGYRSKLLPGVLLQQAVQLLQDSNPGTLDMQNLCNLCWCAAVLDLQQYVPQVLQLADAAKHMWAAAPAENLLQMYQVHLWMLDSKLPAPDQGLSGVWSQQQLQQRRDSWQQQLLTGTASVRASDLQRSVFTAVQALPDNTWQHAPVLEQRTSDGSLNIDIAATTVSGVRLAIEVEGPTHYVQPRGTYNGATLFRNRALAARGYVLVSIPYWEWDRLRGAEEKQQYLKTKLQAAAPRDSSSSNSSSTSSSSMRVRRRREAAASLTEADFLLVGLPLP